MSLQRSLPGAPNPAAQDRRVRRPLVPFRIYKIEHVIYNIILYVYFTIYLLHLIIHDVQYVLCDVRAPSSVPSTGICGHIRAIVGYLRCILGYDGVHGIFHGTRFRAPTLKGSELWGPVL